MVRIVKLESTITNKVRNIKKKTTFTDYSTKTIWREVQGFGGKTNYFRYQVSFTFNFIDCSLYVV